MAKRSKFKIRPDDPRREILHALERAGAPLTPDELASACACTRANAAAFSAALAELERSGEVIKNRAGALLVAKRIALVAGRIEGHPDGHGFLVPDDRSPSVLLPPAEMRGVMHGDRASVRVAGRDHRGRPTGTIVEVLERSNRRIVGRLQTEHGVLFLVPEDRRIAHDILVPPAEAGRGKAGEVVTVELVAQPSKHAQPIGRVAEVLGHYADPGMEIEIAVRKFDLPHEFSKKAHGRGARDARCGAAGGYAGPARPARSAVRHHRRRDGEGLRRRGVLPGARARAFACGWRSPTSATTCGTATRSTPTPASAAPRCTSRGA